MKRPPIAVLVIAVLLILVGGFGLYNDARSFTTISADHYEFVLAGAVHLLAIVAGVFLLRGHNWARWVAVLWMAFHVAISYPSVGKILGHSAFLLLFVWLLFLVRASRAWFALPLPPES